MNKSISKLITKNSNDLYRYINNNRDLIKYKSLTITRKDILKRLFRQIETAYLHKPQVIKPTIYYKQRLPVENYIPKMIREDINENYTHVHETIYKYGVRDISVKLYNNKKIDTTTISNILAKINMWMFIATTNAVNVCSEKLDIHIYFTEHKKIMPHNNNQVDRINANTAYTTSCKPETDIHIYRSEEWFKVLIHETFHSLGLDFSTMDDDISNRRLQEIFSIDTENLRLYESYCESWAEMWNLIIISFLSVNRKSEIDEMIARFEMMLQCEVLFSMYQAHKILANAGVTYNKLVLSNHNNYTENTNAFSYFIVKSMLLYNANNFLTWCNKSNKPIIDFKKDDANVKSYCDLIQTLSRNKDYIADFALFENNVMGDIVDKDSLRMTVFELL